MHPIRRIDAITTTHAENTAFHTSHLVTTRTTTRRPCNLYFSILTLGNFMIKRAAIETRNRIMLYIHLALRRLQDPTGLLRPNLGYTRDHSPVVHRPEYIIEQSCRVTRQSRYKALVRRQIRVSDVPHRPSVLVQQCSTRRIIPCATVFRARTSWRHGAVTTTTKEPIPPNSFTLFAFAAYFLAKHSIASSIWAFSFLISSCACFTATCPHTSSVLWMRLPHAPCVDLTRTGWRGSNKKTQARFWSSPPGE